MSEEVEKAYTIIIPLRRFWLNYPRWKRTPHTVRELRKHIAKITHSENIEISPELNELIWEKGAKNPPRRVKVSITKYRDGRVIVTLPVEEISTETEAK